MNKIFIILLLLGHALTAQAMPDDEITLKLDSRLSSAAIVGVSSPTLISPITPHSAHAEAKNMTAPLPSAAHDMAPAANQLDTRNKQPEVEKYLTLPVNKRNPLSEQIASKKQDRSAYFRLKLSGTKIDESRIGKISAKERTLLLAWQKKLLDADNLSTTFLSMQNQVKQLQDETKVIKLQLANLGVSPATAPSPAPAPSSTTVPSSEQVQSSTLLATANTPESGSIPTSFAEQPVEQQDNQDLQHGLFATFGLVIVIVALWLGLPYYTKIKSSFEIKSQQRAEPVTNTADDVAVAPKMAIAAKPDQQAASFQAKSAHTPAVLVSLNASKVRNQALPPPPQEIAEEVTDEDSMLEKAKPYVTHGRPAKAIEKLQDKPGPLPSLQYTENFLADFDPKRDGSVNEFLASRNAVTPEQLIGWSKYLPANRHFALRLVGAPSLRT